LQNSIDPMAPKFFVYARFVLLTAAWGLNQRCIPATRQNPSEVAFLLDGKA